MNKECITDCHLSRDEFSMTTPTGTNSIGRKLRYKGWPFELFYFQATKGGNH